MMNRRDALTTMSIAGGASLIPSADAIAGSLTAGASEAFQQAVRGTAPVKIRDIKTILTAPNRIRLVVVKVETTEPGFAGDTAQGARKPATLETGLVVQVPLFVNEGDTVRVDTRTGEYQTRV